MKKIEKIALSACALTVIILTFFYLFALIGQLTDPMISFTTFLLILGFSLIISLTSLILRIERMKMIVRIIIHYASLLVAFTVIFLISGNLSAGGTPVVFSAIVVFTFLYAVIFALTYFIKRTIGAADKKIDKRLQAKATPTKSKSEYKSLYSSKD